MAQREGDDSINIIYYPFSTEVEVVYARGGSDLVSTGSGADKIYAGAGDDTVEAAGGNDLILGEDGQDMLRGGSGNDTIDGGGGVDTALYGDGLEYYTLEMTNGMLRIEHNRSINGVVSDDSDMLRSIESLTFYDFYGSTRKVTYSVSDLFAAGLIANVVKGGSASDKLIGGSNPDHMYGYGGNDTLFGGALNDRLDGGDGNDILIGGIGRDTLIGGNGSDTASYDGAPKGVVANLTKPGVNTNDAKGDTYSSIENLTGSSYADTLTGNSGANTLSGGAGNDVLDGGAGNDKLVGGAGADKLIGGDNTDTASYGTAKTGVIANLAKATLNTGDAKGDTYSSIENLAGTNYGDKLTGNTGANVLSGGGGIDTLDGGTGNDTLVGGAGADKLIGGGNTDTASYESAQKGVTANLTKSSVNTNDAKGDTYSSIENLKGSGYADILTGNTGANTISGGLGKDLLVGGAGKDTFVFDSKLGSTNIDTIDDFIAKDDTILLDDDIFTKAGKIGDLSSAAFYAGAKAHDANDRVIYDKATGKLWYDADGKGVGTAIQFALLDKGLTLTESDFDIIA